MSTHSLPDQIARYGMTLQAERLGFGMHLVQKLTRRSRAICEDFPEMMERALPFLDGINTSVAIIECHEAHLPGDCPLCGAK